MADTATRDRVRLHIGDTDSTRPLLNDNEVNLLIDLRGGNALLAAADACDAISAKFAREYDLEWAGAGRGTHSKYSRSQMTKQYADRAEAFRKRANSVLSTIRTSRVDGYSEDIDSREGAGQTGPGGRVRAGYVNPDVLR